jgi:hypothetical protein
MGYRNYIGIIPKREYNKIKSMNRTQLIEYFQPDMDEYLSERQEGYFGVGAYDIGVELYEFGKYVDFNPPKSSMKTFFKKKEIHNIFNCDGELFVVTPEFLEYVIESYKKRIVNYYNDMANPFFGKREAILDREKPTNFLNSVKVEYNYPNNKYTFDFSKITQEEQNALWEIIDHIRIMRSEWTLLEPYDLTGGNSITTSWKYEYSIFELVRIYKSFDWKKNIMYYYGY